MERKRKPPVRFKDSHSRWRDKKIPRMGEEDEEANIVQTRVHDN